MHMYVSCCLPTSNPFMVPLPLLLPQEVAGASGASRAELEKTSKQRQGTALWRAPELFVSFRSSASPDRLSDLFFLGVVFWEVRGV